MITLLRSQELSGGGGDGDRRTQLLHPQLQAVERRVAPALAQQLVVTPRFDDRSVFDDEDAVSIDDGVQAMCDHDRRSPLAEVLDRALNLTLGLRIERSRRLVEQDDRRVLEQGARDGDALALAAGDLQAVLTDLRFIPARERRDEVVRVSGLGGGDDLGLARTQTSERDILAHRAAKQENILPDIGDLAAQRAARYRRNVLSVDDDGAAVDVIEAQDQIENCRFTAARGSDEWGDMAGFRDEGQVPDDLLAPAIRELHVREFDPRLRKLQRRLAFVSRFGRGVVDDLEQDAHPDQSAVEVDIETGEALGWLISQHEGREKREELTERGPGLDHAEAAVSQCAGDRESAERLHQRARAIGDARPFVRFVLEVGNASVEAPAHGLFERERLDDAHALQGLLQRFENARAAGELMMRNRLDAADHLAQDQHRRRYHDDAEHGQHGILHGHDRGKPDEGKQITTERRNEEIEDVARRRGAGRKARRGGGAIADRKKNT